MPNYDRRCVACGNTRLDQLEPIQPMPDVRCECGGSMDRGWYGAQFPGVVPDAIPGGVEIRNGICHDDGSPRKFYSRSEMARAAKEKGVVNLVEHIGARGSDKSKHTVRWTCTPLPEDVRHRDWHAHEQQLEAELSHGSV